VGGHLLKDLSPPLGEVLDYPAPDPLDVRGSPLNGSPRESQALADLPPQHSLVEKPGGLGVPVEVTGIQSRPPAIRALGQIAGHSRA